MSVTLEVLHPVGVISQLKDDWLSTTNFQKGKYERCQQLSSILVKFFKSRTSKFLERNHLLNLNQFGFRSDESTVGAVSKIVRDMISRFEEGSCVRALVLCDLSNAFDCVKYHRPQTISLARRVSLCCSSRLGVGAFV